MNVLKIPIVHGDRETHDSTDGMMDAYDPATGEVIARFSCAGADEVNAVVGAARVAFDDGPWRKMRPFERGRIMQRIADSIMKRRDELVRMECRDSGKPLRDAYWEIDCAARNFEFYGGAADKLQGSSIPLGNGWMDWTIREPVGVSLHIVPWNYPFQLIARGVAPALAAGCAVIIKPSEETPTTAYEFVKICREAGLPAGQVNLAPGRGSVAGDLLARHPGVDQITFTGSVATGQKVLAAAATHTIPCSMELGGKSPQILFADANLDAALDIIAAAAFLHCGQVCNAGTRLLVERRVHNQAVDKLHAKARALKLGKGLDDPGMGPLINKTQRSKVQAYYELAAKEGELLLGGELPRDPALKEGNFVRPALVTNASNTARVAREEIFGPILTIIPFESAAEAIAIANDSPYGLVAGVHTKNIDAAMQMSEKLRVGQVWINSFWVGLDVEFPFGGFKQSGFGREKGLEALTAYQQIKNVCVSFPAN
ncbi:MAG TPA: aldehyde dehydrogenase family protein [Pseudolabrys sp.]|nr:aldehyde dehydrogenase family protein [Pseudolabrys sp.]